MGITGDKSVLQRARPAFDAVSARSRLPRRRPGRLVGGETCVRMKEARRTVAMEQTNLKYPPSNVSPFRFRSAMAARPTIRAVCVLAVLAVCAAHLAAETNQVRSFAAPSLEVLEKDSIVALHTAT